EAHARAKPAAGLSPLFRRHRPRALAPARLEGALAVDPGAGEDAQAGDKATRKNSLSHGRPPLVFVSLGHLKGLNTSAAGQSRQWPQLSWLSNYEKVGCFWHRHCYPNHSPQLEGVSDGEEEHHVESRRDGEEGGQGRRQDGR